MLILYPSQVHVYDSMLELRIKVQKSVQLAASLPGSAEELVEGGDAQLSRQLAETRATALDVARALLKLQGKLGDGDDQVVQDVETEAARRKKEYESARDETLDKWIEKTRVARGAKPAGQGLLEQLLNSKCNAIQVVPLIFGAR